MTLSVTDAFESAVYRADARIRMLIDIYDGTTHWKATDGSMSPDSDLADTDAAVIEVDPVMSEIDPFTREAKIDEVFIKLVPAWARDLFVNNRLEGQLLTVKLGAYELDEADFINVFTGLVGLPDGGEAEIGVSATTVFDYLAQKKITGYWYNLHPLEVIYNGTDGILDKAGIPAAYINTTDFDPTSATYTGSISHLIISRGGSRGDGWQAVDEPTNAFDLAREVARLINAYLFVNESGQIALSYFDATASADDSWDTDDIIPGTFETIDGDTNIVNRIVVNFARERQRKTKTQSFRLDDETSQTNHAFLGATDRVFEEKIDSDWLDAVSHVFEEASSAASTLKLGMTGSLAGFSGLKYGLAAARQVSSSRPVYLMVLSTPKLGSTQPSIEIIKSESVSVSGTYARDCQIAAYDPEDGSVANEGPFYSYAEFGSLTRGMFGTPAQTLYAKSWVYDCTIPVLLCQALLARFKNGCPVISFRTPLNKIKYQIGDFINITWPYFLRYGFDGLTADKFEIVGKQIEPSADPPSISWQLAYTGSASPTSTGSTPVSRSNIHMQQIQAMQDRDAMTPYVVTGLEVSDSGGLDISVSVGIASDGNGGRYGSMAAIPRTLTGTRDTFVVFDLLSGSVIFYEDAVAASAPDLPFSQILLARVTTDATDITSLLDARTWTGIPADRVDVNVPSQDGVYKDTFEQIGIFDGFSVGDTARPWYMYRENGTISVVSGSGEIGGNALSMDEYGWLVSTNRIPYDPTKLYRMRCRVKMTARDSGSDATLERVLCGFIGYGTDKARRVDRDGLDSYGLFHNVCANESTFFADYGLNAWVTFTGWFGGHAAVLASSTASSPSTDPTAPRDAHALVAYMAPTITCNFAGGDGTMLVDYIAIDVFDEDGHDRVYQTVGSAANSYQVNADKVVRSSIVASSVTASKMWRKSQYGAINLNHDFSMWDDL